MPYSPVPTVAPTTQAPDDYQRIDAQPGAFGAQIGAATQQLGKTGEAAGATGTEAAVGWQTLYNNVATDHAFNDFQKHTNDVLYGDPNDPSKPGYYSLHGQAAVDARPGVLQELDTARTGIRTGLANPMQQLGFDEASRRLNMYSASGIGSHSEQEYNRYATEVQTARINLAARDAANNHNNDQQFQDDLEHALQGSDADVALREGAVKGTPAGDAVFANARLAVTQKLYDARAVAMGNADPVAGEAFVKANLDKFDANRAHTLLGEFKANSDAADVAKGANDVFTNPAAGTGPPRAAPGIPHGVTPSTVFNGLIGTEASGPGAVSAKGATGTAQIIEGTFNQYKLPGESYANEDDRRAAAHRYIDDMWKKYPGDAQRIAVGYFSGPGNIAPAGSPTPWIEDKSDGINTTSQYVAKFAGKMGLPTGGAVPSGPAPGGPAADPNIRPAAATFDPANVAGTNGAADWGTRKEGEIFTKDGQTYQAHDGQIFRAQGTPAAAAATPGGTQFAGPGVPTDGTTAPAMRETFVKGPDGKPVKALVPTDGSGPAVPVADTPTSAPAPLPTPSNATPSDLDMMQRARNHAAELFPNDPVKQRAMEQQVYTRIEQDNTLRARDTVAAAKAKRDGEEKAGDDIYQQIMRDPAHFDPAATIDNNAALDVQHKEHFRALANEMLQRSIKGEPLAAVSHQNTTELNRRLTLPDGDPNKITDMQPIDDAFNAGKLSTANYSFLRVQFADKRTDDGQRLGQTEQRFLTAVKPTVEKSNPLMGTLDMTGGTEFFRLQQDIAAKVAEYRKAGKDPYDLFNPSKPDYFGNPATLSQYQKSIPESLGEYTLRMKTAQTPAKPPPVTLPLAPRDTPAGTRPPIGAVLPPMAPRGAESTVVIPPM
ncbi:MAG TPA: hypothetical protein VNW90_10650 [Acetobacteraceae bacterium]|nr:hypothetical protein [Acetobacteraceae bacterium]